MKKRYFAPETLVVRTAIEQLMSGSGVQSDNGIGYGGVDEDGSKDPSVRRHRSEWDDEEEEL